MSTRLRRAFDWCFRDRTTGRITIAQFPNLSLGIVIAMWVLRRVAAPTGTAATWVSAIGSGALVWWALDELVRGVNPWRRALGAVVLPFAVTGLVGALR